MSDWKLNLYHQMPAFLRAYVATLRGYQLRAWRYGPETESLVEQALMRDHWSPQQWQDYQQTRLAFILHRAATQVPYYREQWAQRRRQGDQASWEYTENWPVLDKQALRQTPQAFLADDSNVKQLAHDHTSGTSGTPIHIYRSREMLRNWYALFEARWRRWYGVSLATPWAILGGRLVTPVSQNKPPYWVWNRAMNQLYMSSYHLSPSTVADYVAAIERYGVAYIYCYTSSGVSLAQEIQRSGLQAPAMKVVVTNAEPVYDHQRVQLESVFGCAVRETYGQTESLAAASECEAGRLHLWPEAGYYEILEGDSVLAPGETGDLIATGLMNEDMPLIRYRVGDRVTLDLPEARCTCGRSLPMLRQVEGRIDDVLFTADGRRIGRLDPIFKSDLAIQEAQIIQERLSFIRVRLVPVEGYGPHTEQAIREQLQARMGAIEVAFEPVPSIARTANGKFRAVICQLSTEERASLS